MRAIVLATSIAIFAAAAVVSPGPAQAQAAVVRDTAPAPVASFAHIDSAIVTLHADSVVASYPTIAAAHVTAPAKSKVPAHQTFPLTFAFAAVGTKSKKKKSAPLADPNANPDDPANAPMTAKDARKVPMFVDSDIHLPGEGKDGKHVPTVIKGGVMLDELEEELTDDQVDELISLKAIRPATQAEIAAADSRAEAEE